MLGTRTELLLEDAIYRVRLFYYDANNRLAYIARHEEIDHPENADGWKIWKYVYAGTLLSRVEGPVIGPATNRASLDWRT